MRSYSYGSILPLLLAPADGDALPPGGAPPAAPATPSAAPPPADGDGAEIKMPSKAFQARMEEERAKARARFLKEQGFDDASGLATALADLKKLREEKMTAEEKTAATLKELGAKAEEGAKATATLASAITALRSTLTEAQIAALDEFAPEGTSPAETLKAITMIRKLGGASATPSGPPAPPPPANITPPTGAPKPGTPKSAFTTWQEMGGNDSIPGALYYQANRKQIEATRPPPGAA